MSQLSYSVKEIMKAVSILRLYSTKLVFGAVSKVIKIVNHNTSYRRGIKRA